MRNTFLKIRFHFFAAFGMIPRAEKIEQKEQQLREDFDRLNQIHQSDDFARYQELKEYLKTDEFKQKKKQINARKYKGSEAHQKEKRFKQLKGSEPLKTYLKVKDSKGLDHFQRMENSSELAKYYELKEFFGSQEFEEFKKSLKEKQQSKHQYFKEYLARYKKLQKKYGWYYRFRDSSQYARFLEVHDSDKLRRFNELARESGAKKNPEYKQLKKDPDIRFYQKFSRSGKLKKFRELQDSQAIKDLEALAGEVQSEDFQRLPEDIEQLKFKNTEEYQRYQEYKKLEKNRDVKKALRFKDSKKYGLYQQALDSGLPEEYQELKNYLESEAFRETQKFLKRRNKFKYSDEYAPVEEFERLDKSDAIRWYFKNVNDPRFDFLRGWERSFADHFDQGELDHDKWLTSYYWGKALLNDSYVQATDKHFFTDGTNVELENGECRIVTRKEEVEGKVWHPGLGFYPSKFAYTSGLINTGQSFRQKYGIFRAKARLSHVKHLRHSFWLVPEKILPEIDVFHYHRKSARKMDVASYSGNYKDRGSVKIKRSRIGGLNFSRRYMIYEVHWQPKAIVWKINGVTVRRQTKGVPQEPMYMILNSGVDGDINEEALPSQMHLDWVEAYREK